MTQATDREQLARIIDPEAFVYSPQIPSHFRRQQTALAKADAWLSSVKPAQPTTPTSDDRRWLARQLLDVNLTDTEAYSAVAFAPEVKDQWKPAQPTADVAWGAHSQSEGVSLIEGLPLKLDEERGMSLWLDPEYAPNQTHVAITRDLLRRLCRVIQAGNDEAEEAHRLGKSDGYEEAVADLDRLTGGDGEYVFSTLPGGGCPDPNSMKARIVERFAILSAYEAHQRGEG